MLIYKKHNYISNNIKTNEKPNGLVQVRKQIVTRIKYYFTIVLLVYFIISFIFNV